MANFLGGNQSDVHPYLLKHGRDVVARAHDVSDFQIMRHLHVNDAHALPRRLVVVEAAEVFARDRACILRCIFRLRMRKWREPLRGLCCKPAGKTLN